MRYAGRSARWDRGRRARRAGCGGPASIRGFSRRSSRTCPLLDGIGFDPYIGFLHRLDYGRPSLALDLLEEFRPALVDRFTTRLLNLGILSRVDFTRGPDGGLYLAAKANAATSPSTRRS